MTFAALEKKLRAFEEPLDNPFLQWLYHYLPPRRLRNKKMHQHYASAVSVLLEILETGELNDSRKQAIEEYLQTIVPFVEQFEKKAFPLKATTPEEMVRFLMKQHDLTQYDLAKELGGQPVVSAILRGKRKLTREHIERLSQRFGTTPAAFYSRPPAA